jgi:hypothetical protein
MPSVVVADLVEHAVNRARGQRQQHVEQHTDLIQAQQRGFF